MKAKERTAQCCHVCGDLDCSQIAVGREKKFVCANHRKELQDRMGYESKNSLEIKFIRTLALIDAYVDQYQSDNPEATKLEACMAYAKEKGIHIPPVLVKNIDLEREAIVQESEDSKRDFLQDLSDGVIK